MSTLSNLDGCTFSSLNATLDRKDMEENTLIYAFTVDTVIRDQTTGKFTFVGIFEMVNIPKELPSIIYPFNIVGKIANVKQGHVAINIELVAPSGESLKSDLEGDVSSGDLDIAATLPAARFKEEGRHYIRVTVNGVRCEDGNRFYIDVKKLT